MSRLGVIGELYIRVTLQCRRRNVPCYINMSAPMKRSCDESNDLDTQTISNKSSSIQQSDEKLGLFLKWAKDNTFCLNKKVTVAREGSCAQYGMVAVEDIMAGECLFQIPRIMLLSPENSGIANLLTDERECLESDSGWVPLLVTLMYEYNHPQSSWRPYLDLCPDFKELDLLMFWEKKERESLLTGTGVLEAVDRDISSITKEFNNIVLPFIRKHKDLFSSACEDIEFYKKMVAFVMAYSFTEPQSDSDDEEEEEDGEESPPPMMVPMADILNHIAKNNARLTFEKDALKMVASKHISRGEEVFNTYGQLSNWHLLHMYGFAEQYPDNVYDTVDITADTVHSQAETLDIHKADPDLLKNKWNFLIEQEILKEDDSFVLGMEGFLTEDVMYSALKVCAMTKDEFTSHKENEGWSDDDGEDNEEEESLSFDAIQKLPPTWKTLLLRVASSSLKRYVTTLEEDEKNIKSGCVHMSERQKFAIFTQYGQKKLIHKLIESCS